MNVFISQPMESLTNNEIKQRRLELLNMIKERYPTKEIHLIANPPCPCGCNSSVWYLGKFLECIAQADLVFFSKNWECTRGCSFEHSICVYYGIPIAYEDV